MTKKESTVKETAGTSSEPITTAVAPRQKYTVADIHQIGTILAKSQLFGISTPEQAIALCLIADAEGQHPAMAAMDYDIIQGRPAIRSKALLGRFLNAGGKVEWLERTDECVKATFSHPAGGSVTVDWDTERAKQAGLMGKDNWKKWPRQMRTARVVSEGVGVVWPSAAKFYVPEEIMDFEPRDITSDVKVEPPEHGTVTVEVPSGAALFSPDKDTTTAKEKMDKAKADAKERTAEKSITSPAKVVKESENEEPVNEEPSDFKTPTGVILTKAKVNKIVTVFKKYNIDVELLVKWRKLAVDEWTESVRAELLNLYKGVKAGDCNKELLEEMTEEEESF